MKTAQQKNETEYISILEKYDNYITKFCEIAEREVSVRDEWGDENWEALSKIKNECILRIATQMHEEVNPKTKESEFEWELYLLRHSDGFSGGSLWEGRLYDELDRRFREYHEKRKENYIEGKVDLSKMSGVEFENYLISILKSKDYNTSGTPATGDQGADIIASKDDKVYVIQVKRHSKPIGNKAVQEVVAARNYYKGDTGVVVTNNIFTPSAKSLAKRNDVILISGNEIPQIADIL